MPPRDRKPKTIDEKVAALAVVVEGLEKDVAAARTEAKAATDIAKAGVTRIVDHVRAHPGGIRRYASRSQAGAEADDQADEPEEPEEAPLNLLTCVEPELVAEALHDLAGWLRKVYARYGDAQLGECWAYHPAVAQRLWALYQVWKAAHGEGVPYSAVMDWEIRYRVPIAAQIGKELEWCKLSKHVNPVDYTPPGVYGTEHLGELAQWYGDGKHAAYAPPPPDINMLKDAEQRAEAADRR